MSEAKHAPGHWVIRNTGRDPDVFTAAGDLVCSVYTDENAEADARLIAAAPDLLEALVLLEREMVLSGNAGSEDYGWKPAIKKTRAAISRAEGRS